MGTRRLCSLVLSAFCLVLPVSSLAQDPNAHTTPATPTQLTFPVTAAGAASATQFVSLNNYSSQSSVPITALTVSGPFTVDASNCTNNTIPSGGQCYLAVTAKPTATGAFTGTMTITTSQTVPGTPDTVALSVSTLPAGSTTTIITASPTSPYSLTGTVTGSHGAAAPTGSVSFTDTTNNKLSLGSAALGAGSFKYALNTYAPPPVGLGPDAIASGDFNGDGKLDVVVANGGFPGCQGDGGCPNTLSILLGKGDGTFTTGSTITAFSSANGLAVADFNGDGKADIATNDGASSIVLLLGKGDGTFTQSSKQTATASGLVMVITGDFNKDGKADLAVIGYGANSLSILLGHGDGTFATGTAASLDGNPEALAAGDLNGDGIIDLAVACPGDYNSSSPSTIDILIGDGKGNFSKGSTISSANLGTYSSFPSIAIGDFNGDKKLDLVTFVTNNPTDPNQPDTISLLTLIGKGDGTFTAQPLIATADDEFQANVGAADFDGDGKADIALVDDTHLSVYLSNGDGTFQSPVSVQGAVTDPSYIPQIIADFNGDGLPDLAIADSDLNIVRLQVSNRTATAAATLTGVTIPGTGANHDVSASYAGDSAFTASTSATTSLTPSTLTTGLKLISSTSASTFGAQVVLTATLSPYTFSTLSTNGQTVTFQIVTATGVTTLGTGTLSSGVATLNTTTLAVGTDPISARYSSDSNFASATSNTVSVTVAAAPLLTIAPPSLIFQSQTLGTSSTAQMVTLTNTGTAALTISSIAITGDFAQTNTCVTGLATSASCIIAVTFTPTATGTRGGTITITDNASGSPHTVSLTGAAVAAPPILSINPTSLTFTTQLQGTTSTAQTITLNNTGTAALAITSLAASGDFAQTNTCGTSLAASKTCTISVTFTPTATGTRSGSVTITDNASGSPQTVSLTGTGTTSDITILAGTSSLTIANSGGTATSVLTFSAVNGFGGAISLSCAVTFQGTGTATTPPTCALSPTSVNVVVGTTATSTLTVSTTAATSSAAPLELFRKTGIALAALLFLGIVPRRRFRGRLLLPLICFVLLGAAVGCGGSSPTSSTSTTKTSGTTTGNYQVAVTATSGSTVVTSNLTLNLQ